MKINNWENLSNYKDDDIICMDARVVHNPNKETMLGLESKPDFVYSASFFVRSRMPDYHINGLEETNIVNILLFPIINDSKNLTLCIKLKGQNSQTLSLILNGRLKSIKSFVEYLKFNLTLHPFSLNFKVEEIEELPLELPF